MNRDLKTGDHITICDEGTFGNKRYAIVDYVNPFGEIHATDSDEKFEKHGGHWTLNHSRGITKVS